MEFSATQHGASVIAPWLRCTVGGEPPAVRLICLPHAGAGASSFNGWPFALPPWVEVVKVQLPGRADEPSHPPFRRIDDLMPELFPQVTGLLDRPVAIYGHSVGALIAFELTRELRRHGYPMPIALFVSGRRAPHKPLRNILLYNLPEPALVVQLRKLGGKPSIFLNNARWRRHYLPTIRADLQLSDVYTYRDERPLECPLHAFVGEADDLMHREDWEAWSEQAGADFSRCLLPGGHIFDRNTQALLITRIAGILTATLTRGVPGASRCVPTRSADGIAVAQAGA